jgi:hypothetical protein
MRTILIAALLMGGCTEQPRQARAAYQEEWTSYYEVKAKRGNVECISNGRGLSCNWDAYNAGAK